MASFEEMNRYASDLLAQNIGVLNPNYVSMKIDGELNQQSQNRFTADKTRTDGIGQYSAASPRAYANYLGDILAELKDNPGKGAAFIASQAALHALNLDFGRGMIFNPSSIFLPPFAGGFSTDSLDNPFADNNPGTQQNYQQDRLKNMYKGEFVQPFAIENAKSLSFGPGFRFSDGTSMEEKNASLNIYSEEKTMTENYIIDPFDDKKPIDYNRIFEKRNGPSFGQGEAGGGFNYARQKPKPLSSVGGVVVAGSRLLSSDISFNDFDAENGYFTADSIQDGGSIEDVSYVPFYFVDLRKPGRGIAFRAFIKGFSERLSPTWNKQMYYGRVDPVPTYMNTERTISVDFTITCDSKSGFETMWKKINHLSKMVYPQFKNSTLNASPVCRMKIGDVVSGIGGRGQPGYIESLNFDYSESIWEVDPYNGTLDSPSIGPRVINCSLSFQIIHEQNPAIDENYNFDTQNFRGFQGRLPTEVAETAAPEDDQTQARSATEIPDSSRGVSNNGTGVQ